MFIAKIAAMRMAAGSKLLGSIPSLLAGYALKALYMLPMLYLWRSLNDHGAGMAGYTVDMLLSYTAISALLSPILNPVTPLSTWHYEGQLIGLCARPQGLFSQLIWHTVGTWLPELMLFSLPMGAVLSLVGISLTPATLWFLPVIILSVSLGFAVEFLFDCLVIRMKSAAWLALVIRSAVFSLLSGAVIPFRLLPFGLGPLFEFLPFASMASAPLTVFVGSAAPMSVIPFQLLWNVILWPMAYLAFNKSLEGMVSYGG